MLLMTIRLPEKACEMEAMIVVIVTEPNCYLSEIN